MPQGLAPLSYASIIVGFTSFTFTVFTFVRVFWEVIKTMWGAEHDMVYSLDNLRSELYGERAYFRTMLRRQRARSRSLEKAGGARDRNRTPSPQRWRTDVDALKLMNASVKNLLKRLREVEQPFMSQAPANTEKDVEQSWETIRGNYAPMTLTRRWIWMRRKQTVLSMWTAVDRLQSRRIACDTSLTLLRLHMLDKKVLEMDDRMWDIEEHLMGERLSDGEIYVKRRVPRS